MHMEVACKKYLLHYQLDSNLLLRYNHKISTMRYSYNNPHRTMKSNLSLCVKRFLFAEELRLNFDKLTKMATVFEDDGLY